VKRTAVAGAGGQNRDSVNYLTDPAARPRSGRVYFCKASQNGCFSHYKDIHLYKK